MKFQVGDKVKVKTDCKSFGGGYAGREGTIKHETPENEELYWIDFGDKPEPQGISISITDTTKIIGCHADGSTPFDAKELEAIK